MDKLLLEQAQEVIDYTSKAIETMESMPEIFSATESAKMTRDVLQKLVIIASDTIKDKLVAALTNALETHHNLELANNPSYPATSVYIATKVALEAALREA